MKMRIAVVQMASVLALTAAVARLTDHALFATLSADESVKWQYETGG